MFPTPKPLLRRVAPLGALLCLLSFAGRVPAACEATQPDALGPYYQPSAPFSDTLAAPDEQGERLTVSGRVVGSPDCAPVEGAVVDVWQASAAGRYYFEDPYSESKGDTFTLRGRMRTDENGRYRFETVVPARYPLGGGRFRPPHIHYRVTHPDYESLTTQLYIGTDRDVGSDPFARNSRVISLERQDPQADQGPYYTGTFDIILRPRLAPGPRVPVTPDTD